MTPPATASAPASNLRPQRDWADLLGKLGPLIGLILIFALFSILRPDTFFSWNNVEIMLLQTAVVGIAAVGMTMVIVSGGIDLSVGSLIALVTVAIAILIRNHVPPALAAVGGIATGALVGLMIGGLVTGLRLAPFIVTLGMWGALRGVAIGLANRTTIPSQTWLNDILNIVGGDTAWMIFPPGVWLMFLVAGLASLVLRYTRFGRHVFAIGSNEPTARLCGVSVVKTKLLIYTAAATLTGIAGVLQFSYLSGGDPTTAKGYELNVIAAVVVGGASLSGGQGSIFGTLVGAFIVTVVRNGSTKLGLANELEEIVTGAMIIIAVALDRLRQRRAA